MREKEKTLVEWVSDGWRGIKKKRKKRHDGKVNSQQTKEKIARDREERVKVAAVCPAVALRVYTYRCVCVCVCARASWFSP